jgi:hypothetical protein
VFEPEQEPEPEPEPVAVTEEPAAAPPRESEPAPAASASPAADPEAPTAAIPVQPWRPSYTTTDPPVTSAPEAPAAPAAPPAEPKAKKEKREKKERAPREGKRSRTPLIILGAAVAVVILVVGIAFLLGKAFDEGGVDYAELKAGDCFKQPSGRFSNVETVPCDQEHDLEVYAVLDHPAGPAEPFPGMDNLVRYANPLCLAQFRNYAGVPFEQLNLRDVYITPRDSRWKDGGRKLVCAVGAENQQPTDKSIKAGAG